MGVGIDETGKDHASAKIQFFSATGSGGRFNFLARADRKDLAVAEEQGGIFDYGEVGEGIATARNGATQGEELGDSGEE